MIEELRHKSTGETLSEVIAQFPGELDRDAVGLFQVVPVGKQGFGLSGEALTDFVRKAIYALLEAGAVPVRGVRDSEFLWVAQRQYGDTHREIAESVLDEWRSLSDDPLVLAGLGVWFARPRNGEKYVKQI